MVFMQKSEPLGDLSRDTGILMRNDIGFENCGSVYIVFLVRIENAILPPITTKDMSRRQ